MRAIISLVVVVFLFHIKVIAQVEFFEYDSDRILQLSKAEGKTILLYFTAEYCGPCKGFEKEIFYNEEISDLINEFYIPVKISSKRWEDDSLTQDLLKQFEIKGYPVLIFINNKGDIICRKDGIDGKEDIVFNKQDSLSQVEIIQDTELQNINVHFNVERFYYLFNEYAPD